MQCRSRKRLDFTAGTSSRKPFKGSVFYLDLSEHPKQARTLEKELIILGGNVASFLSKDANISYVVTTQKDVTSKLTDVANTAASPLLPNKGGLCSPATPGDSPSPLSCDAVAGSGAPYASYVHNTRAQKILQKATHGAKLSTASRKDVVSTVKDWDGVKVVSLERLLRIVEKHRHIISGDAGSQAHLVTQRKTSTKPGEAHVHHLQAPYVKVEDLSCQYRPLYLELTTWPRPDFNSSAGSCPFESTDKGPYVVPIEQSNRVRLRLSENKQKRRSSEKTAEQSAKTAEQSAKEDEPPVKKAAEVAGGWKRKGYCECCGIKFECLNTHLASSQHIKFATDDRNYKDLDELIRRAQCSLDEYISSLPTRTHAETSESGTPSADAVTSPAAGAGAVQQPGVARCTSPARRRSKRRSTGKSQSDAAQKFSPHNQNCCSASSAPAKEKWQESDGPVQDGPVEQDHGSASQAAVRAAEGGGDDGMAVAADLRCPGSVSVGDAGPGESEAPVITPCVSLASPPAAAQSAGACASSQQETGEAVLTSACSTASTLSHARCAASQESILDCQHPSSESAKTKIFVAPRPDSQLSGCEDVTLLPSSIDEPPATTDACAGVHLTPATCPSDEYVKEVCAADIQPPLPKESPPSTPPAPSDTPTGSPPLRRSLRRSLARDDDPVSACGGHTTAALLSPASRKRTRQQMRLEYSPAQSHLRAAACNSFATASPKSVAGFHIADFTSSPGFIDQQAVSRAIAHLEESSSCEYDLPTTPRRRQVRKRKRSLALDSSPLPTFPPLPSSLPPPQPPLPPPPLPAEQSRPVVTQPPLPTSPPLDPPPLPATSPPKRPSPSSPSRQPSKRQRRRRHSRCSSLSCCSDDLGVYAFP